MKAVTLTLSVLNLAGAILAAPASKMQAREPGLFGQGDNLVSNIFDGTACIVSSVIGGGNPRCHGKGAATVTPPDGNQSRPYHYTYDTNQDGSLKITITFASGGSCTYNLKADGKDVKNVVSQAAKMCGNEKE